MLEHTHIVIPMELAVAVACLLVECTMVAALYSGMFYVGQTADMGAANGYNRGSKSGLSAEQDPDYAHQGRKRSRLGMTLSDAQQAEAAQDHARNGFRESHHVDNGLEGQPEMLNPSQTDVAYHGVMEMVHQVHNCQVSEHACRVKDQMRNLDAAEGIGVMAWLIDGMLSQRTDPSAIEMIAGWVTDLADFAKHRLQLSRT